MEYTTICLAAKKVVQSEQENPQIRKQQIAFDTNFPIYFPSVFSENKLRISNKFSLQKLLPKLFKVNNYYRENKIKYDLNSSKQRRGQCMYNNLFGCKENGTEKTRKSPNKELVFQ